MVNIVGNINKIDVGSSDFYEFIVKNYLYIDKSKFIEHVLQDSSRVLLFTRQRRMGKSLNIDTLKTFLDITQNSSHLFKNLYIETSSEFVKCNQYPVLYFDFKSYTIESFENRCYNVLKNVVNKLIAKNQRNFLVEEYMERVIPLDEGFASAVMENIYDIYNKKIIVIIDEYDSVLLRNYKHDDIGKLKNFISRFFSEMLKGNRFLEKGILTGVSCIANESIFSDFENAKYYDIFTSSIYGEDFSLTHEELTALCSDELMLEQAKYWYDNITVGNCKLYNIYSVMNY